MLVLGAGWNPGTVRWLPRYIASVGSAYDAVKKTCCDYRSEHSVQVL